MPNQTIPTIASRAARSTGCAPPRHRPSCADAVYPNTPSTAIGGSEEQGIRACWTALHHPPERRLRRPVCVSTYPGIPHNQAQGTSSGMALAGGSSPRRGPGSTPLLIDDARNHPTSSRREMPLLSGARAMRGRQYVAIP